jgi:hypothetical protein
MSGNQEMFDRLAEELDKPDALQAALDELLAQASADAQADEIPDWRPSAGDSIAGAVVAVDRFTPREGDSFPVVTIATRDGEPVRVFCSRSVLRREIAEKHPQPGDLIAVRYNGSRLSGAGRSFHHYSVAVRHQPAAPTEDQPPF